MPFTRRRLLGSLSVGLALLAAACAAPTAAEPTKPAVAAPTVAPTFAATAVGTAVAKPAAPPTTPPNQALRLVPLKPTELGAPSIPAPTKSTAEKPVPHDAAVAAYDRFGTDVATGVFPRTITHAAGMTELKTKAVRVLPLDSGELDSVVQLGLTPAGFLDYDAALMPKHLVEALKDARTVGTLAEPNLEVVASIAPDLILTSLIRHEKIVDQLKAIRPTVFGISTGVVWKQNFALHARALGREEEGNVTVRAYEDRVKALNAKLPTPRPTVSVVRVLNSNLRYYQRANYCGTLLTDFGFQRPPSQNVDDFAMLNQSMETLAQHADADLIVVSPTEGENGAFFKQLLANPLWQNLGAVKRGAVLVVSDDVWMAGIGYRAAGLIHDDIARHFKI